MSNLTIDPAPCDLGSVAECRRRVRSLKEQMERISAILGDVALMEQRGEPVLPALFSAHLLVRLAKFDRRATELADELAMTACEELHLALTGTGPVEQPERVPDDA